MCIWLYFTIQLLEVMLHLKLKIMVVQDVSVDVHVFFKIVLFSITTSDFNITLDVCMSTDSIQSIII